MPKMNTTKYEDIEPTVALFFPSKSVKRSHHYESMFTQDIALGLVPYSGISSSKNITTEIEASDTDRLLAQSVLHSVSRFEGRGDIESCIFNAIRKIAENISWSGCAHFEVLHGKKQVYLLGFTSVNLYKLPLYYLQIVPREDRGIWGRKGSLIRDSKIWRIEIPSELGGLKEYKKTLNMLQNHNSIGPRFFQKDIERGITNNYFDFNKYQRENSISLNRATTNWGWNRRDRNQEYCTEYYTVYKEIRFKYAQAVLIKHIVSEINSLFKRIELDAVVNVFGKPSPSEIMQLEKDLWLGRIVFDEALDVLYGRESLSESSVQ